MTLWLFLLILCGGLLIFGFIVDWIAKKRGIRLNPSEGVKYAGESERILKEQHLQQIHDNLNNPNI